MQATATLHQGMRRQHLECGVAGWRRDVWECKPCAPLLSVRPAQEAVSTVREEGLYVVELPCLVRMYQQVLDDRHLRNAIA